MTIVITKTKLAIAIVALALIGAGTAMAVDDNPFTDVPDSGDANAPFFSEPVEWLWDNGLTTGTSATTFSPNDTVTRGQYAAFNFRYDQNIVQPALEDLQAEIDALEAALETAQSDLETAETNIANLPDVYFAEIDTDGSILRGTFGVTTTGGGDGTMDVNFPNEVDDCVWQATIAQKASLGSFDGNNGEVSLQTDFDSLVADPNGIFVETRDSSGSIAAMPVHLTVTCGLPTGFFVPVIPPVIITLGE